MKMDDNIKKIIDAINQAGKEVKDDTAYLDDREDRVIGYAVGEALQKVARQIASAFSEEEDPDADQFMGGECPYTHSHTRNWCGYRDCRRS